MSTKPSRPEPPQPKLSPAQQLMLRRRKAIDQLSQKLERPLALTRKNARKVRRQKRRLVAASVKTFNAARTK